MIPRWLWPFRRKTEPDTWEKMGSIMARGMISALQEMSRKMREEEERAAIVRSIVGEWHFAVRGNTKHSPGREFLSWCSTNPDLGDGPLTAVGQDVYFDFGSTAVDAVEKVMSKALVPIGLDVN